MLLAELSSRACVLLHFPTVSLLRFLRPISLRACHIPCPMHPPPLPSTRHPALVEVFYRKRIQKRSAEQLKQKEKDFKERYAAMVMQKAYRNRLQRKLGFNFADVVKSNFKKRAAMDKTIASTLNMIIGKAQRTAKRPARHWIIKKPKAGGGGGSAGGGTGAGGGGGASSRAPGGGERTGGGGGAPSARKPAASVSQG